MSPPLPDHGLQLQVQGVLALKVLAEKLNLLLPVLTPTRLPLFVGG